MTALSLLAEDLGVSERTLRRAANQGALRVTRPTPRKVELPLTEREYVRRAWPLLSELRAVLRTESNLRFAMLFGSRARGTNLPQSDIDLLVDMRDPDLDRLVDLTEKLDRAVEPQVDLVRLKNAESDPALLADWLAEGRVLVDRESVWPKLRHRQPALERTGRRMEAKRTALALAGIDEMLRG